MNSHIMSRYRFELLHDPIHANILSMQPISALECACTEKVRNPDLCSKLELPIHLYYQFKFINNVLTLEPIEKPIQFCGLCVSGTNVPQNTEMTHESETKKGAKRVSISL